MGDSPLRDELIIHLWEIRSALVENARLLPSSVLNEPFIGDWGIKDLIAHIIGWDYANSKGFEEILAGQRPSFYNYADRDWRSFNAMLVKQYRREDLEYLLSDLHLSQEHLVDVVSSLPDSELKNDHGVRYKGWKVTIARLMQAEFNDEKVHLDQLRDFIRKCNG